MNSPRITAAARALCKLSATECNINEEDNWKLYGDQFKTDAAVALAAADAISVSATRLKTEVRLQKMCIERLSSQKLDLESALRAYRVKYGVLGQSATPENISQ